MKDTQMKEPWYAVRCLFIHPNRAKSGDGTLYEERITLWKCVTEEEAYIKAEIDAKEYEKEDCVFIRATDAFHLFDDEVKEGSEVWSTMRGSHLDADTYENTFCVTPLDRNHEITIDHDRKASSGRSR